MEGGQEGLRALPSGQQAWLCEQAPPVMTSCVSLAKLLYGSGTEIFN